ncbi:UNVERIFIED_CONTAM: hypothetical protein Sradi_2548400 [Sesamum radiatum]|uniref:Uncharacterized protein n=1 Tax=Sesamum radiatum TaxID=300843 RepID=A0AAW2SNF8_SESRA
MKRRTSNLLGISTSGGLKQRRNCNIHPARPLKYLEKKWCPTGPYPTNALSCELAGDRIPGKYTDRPYSNAIKHCWLPMPIRRSSTISLKHFLHNFTLVFTDYAKAYGHHLSLKATYWQREKLAGDRLLVEAQEKFFTAEDEIKILEEQIGHAQAKLDEALELLGTRAEPKASSLVIWIVKKKVARRTRKRGIDKAGRKVLERVVSNTLHLLNINNCCSILDP